MSNRNKNPKHDRPKPADKLHLHAAAGPVTAATQEPPEDFDPNAAIDPAVLMAGDPIAGQFGEGVGDLGPGTDEVGSSSPDELDAADAMATEKTGEPRGTVLIELPPLVNLTAEETKGYASQHIDVQLRRGEPLAFKRLYRSLIEANARLDGGQGPHVRTAGDVVRWLIQQMPEA